MLAETAPGAASASSALEVHAGQTTAVRTLSFNMNQRDPDTELAVLMGERNVMPFQEVTPTCLGHLHALAIGAGMSVASPAQRGHCSAEGFDDVRFMAAQRRSLTDSKRRGEGIWTLAGWKADSP